jgi:Mrp family chromosome partitioning ATPase
MLRKTTESRESVTGKLVPAAVESSCRALVVQIQSALPLGRALMLGVTSAERGTGRTTVALGLAMAVARQLGPTANVLLIDADIENPTLHERCGITYTAGLSEVLSGEVALEDAAVPIAPGVRLLAAGTAPLNAPRQMKELEEVQFFETLGEHVDALIVDLPPVQSPGLGTLPPRLIPQFCVVTRAGATRREELQQAIATLPADRLAAVLLNAQRQRIPRWIDNLLN